MFPVIVPLNKQHHRDPFNCGEPELDLYFKEFALQHSKKNISRTFVMLPNDTSNDIIGFYTLSSAEIKFSELPEPMRKKLPNYPIPAARIGRLAVDYTMQGKKFGEGLLINALYRCAVISKEMALVCIIVDAKHERAKNFYLQYGFEPIPDNPLKLILPITNVIKQFMGSDIQPTVFLGEK